MNTQLQLIIYHIDGKSVWTVLVITLSKGHMYKFWNINSVILYFVIAIKSYTKLLKLPMYMTIPCLDVYVIFCTINLLHVSC
jgi:hypothetical protein